MPIYTTENISINGSQLFLGGVVYTLSYNQGFNGQPSTVEAGIVSAPQSYQIPVRNFTTPYNIQIGSVYNLKFFCYKYCISDSQSGKILNVFFQDGVGRLQRKWIAPKGSVCPNPNVILIGSVIDNKTVSYSYSQFQAATASLGIPAIQQNEYVRINDQGTVLDIFNRFMAIYGYTWYMENDVIKLIDIKVPIEISQGMAILESNSRKLSSNLCQDISNNFVKGVVALDEQDEDADGSLLSAATSLWDGTEGNQPNIKGAQIFGFYGPTAALYATHSPQMYFAYIWSKFDLLTALDAMGMDVAENIRLDLVPADLLSNQTASPGSPYTLSNAINGRAIVYSDKAVYGAESAYEKDKRLGEVLLRGYYTIQDFNPSVQWFEGSPNLLEKNTIIKEIPDIGPLTFDNNKVSSLTTDSLWLLQFPVQIEYPFSDEFVQQINSMFPGDVNSSASLIDDQYTDNKFRLAIVNTSNESSLIAGGLPEINYPIAPIRYVAGDVNISQDIRFAVPTYGLNGRQITTCLIPPLSDESSRIEIETFENLTFAVQNVNLFIQQNAYSRNQDDTIYSCEIRGINTSSVITPEMGLDSVDIRLDGDNGYISSYNLSSKRERPPTQESSPKQKTTLN